MEIKGTPIDIAKLTESELLSFVADKLKDRVLFPEMVENAKKILNSVTSSVL